MTTTADFNELCNQLLECQCACWAWQGAYTGEVERNQYLYIELERLHALVNAQQERITYVTKENQRLNLLVGHLVPRDIGPATTYKSTGLEPIVDEETEEKEDPPKSDIVQRLETIAEMSDRSSSPSTTQAEESEP
ncbi:hypothetical protein FSST1_011132 [Fusarium sambucinum]